MIAELRKHTDKPVSVGFGISTPEQATQVAQIADGVIVGSAIVNVIEDNMDNEAKLLTAVKQFASDLATGVKTVKNLIESGSNGDSVYPALIVIPTLQAAQKTFQLEMVQAVGIFSETEQVEPSSELSKALAKICPLSRCNRDREGKVGNDCRRYTR